MAENTVSADAVSEDENVSESAPVTEVPEANESETPETEQVDPALVAKAQAFDPFWGIYKQVADEANTLQKQYTDATKGADDAIDTLLNESDDEAVVKWRTWREDLVKKIEAAQASLSEGDAQIRKHAESLVPETAQVDVEALKVAYLEKRKAANLTGQNILALLQGDEAAFKAGLNHYGVTEVIGLRRGATVTGASDIVRKRLASARVDGKPFADSKGKVSFTTLANHLKTDGATLRAAAEKAANVQSVRDIPNGTTVEFTLTVGEKNHTVSITTPEAE